MDLNQLLFHHRVALIRYTFGADAACPSRFDLVRHYEQRIARLRTEMALRPIPTGYDR